MPAEGATFCNYHLPPGTVVGVNAWVIHRDKTIFGADASQFRPERWLDVAPETLKRMNRAYIPVSRNCSMAENIQSDWDSLAVAVGLA